MTHKSKNDLPRIGEHSGMKSALARAFFEALPDVWGTAERGIGR